ncbi:MAG TPA: SpoVR family protein [Armatimonadetes bacterium]|nr:SpoVR family protein [Armatimonadota bacterium]
MAHLTPELERYRAEVEEYARECGLDFFETIFEIVDWQQMNEIASYGGFPVRYPHWRFGMEHERVAKSYAYGLHRIYEMVINNDPCYAYLLECNNVVDQKLVMAHVLAHADFFKNNAWFVPTNRRMIDEMANHAARVRRYIAKHGYETVERFIDCCLSLENLIDPHAPFIKRREEDHSRPGLEEEEEPPVVRKLRVEREYMDSYINPPEFLEQQRRKLEEEKEKKKKFPSQPVKDVLWFLLENAPLESWQRDVLDIIREEAYYFAPQRQTKILNEGWAVYWHSYIMTRKALRPSELIDYADHHSGTLASHQGHLNPYKLGYELLKDIKERWDKGQFGKEWEECEDLEAKRNWDRQLGLGLEKLFEVRRIHNDVTFIDTFLTPEFCEKHKMFTYRYNEITGWYEIASREFQEIKEKLLFTLTNFGDPFIYVVDGNYRNRGELYLLHRHEGVDLRLGYAQATLRKVYQLWQRPVHLETVVDGVGVIFTYDGREHSHKEIRLTQLFLPSLSRR